MQESEAIVVLLTNIKSDHISITGDDNINAPLNVW